MSDGVLGVIKEVHSSSGGEMNKGGAEEGLGVEEQTGTVSGSGR